ncbi:hypothetical protein M6B38_257785 [Iris pallida]|uniref:Uncharacterized protein n=1 Tax=Iris pallida TaxID=29817 RepID=A0AAX6IF53_IRIPA|nr:hypothetical protein M6B38_257785 [Iris pallida]
MVGPDLEDSGPWRWLGDFEADRLHLSPDPVVTSQVGDLRSDTAINVASLSKGRRCRRGASVEMRYWREVDPAMARQIRVQRGGQRWLTKSGELAVARGQEQSQRERGERESDVAVL